MSNYNLMRLANLYGGMNKIAAADVTGDRAIVAMNALKNALAAGQISQEQYEAALKSYGTMAMAENNAATPVLGTQAARDMVFSGASGAKPPVLGSDAEGNTIVLKPGQAPNMFTGLEKWVKENPMLAGAIGAGALGLGGYGAYKAFSNDEEEERKKSASYIDPYTAQVLAHDYITKMARANGIPAVAAGVTGVSNYLNY